MRHATAILATCCLAVVTAGGCGSDAKPQKPEKKAEAVSRQQQLIADLGADGKLALKVGCTIETPRMLEPLHQPEDELAKVEYSSDPPSSGPHLTDWAPWGFYDEPVDDGYAVHNLEHGGVVLWYDDGLPEADLTTIREQVLDQDEKWLVTPRAKQDGFVTSSWGTQLACPGSAVQQLPPDRLAHLLDTWYVATNSKQTEAEAKIPAYAGAMSSPEPDRDISTPSPDF